MLFKDFLQENGLLNAEGKVVSSVQLCDAKSSQYDCDTQYTDPNYLAANNHPVMYVSFPKPLEFRDMTFDYVCLSATLAGKIILAKKGRKKFDLPIEAEISSYIGDNGETPCLQCVAVRQESDCAGAINW